MRLVSICLAALIALPAPVMAQQLLESYVAFLSANDHYNSNGKRLTQVWQIIRQDRANYHRYGTGDAEDQWDSFFGSIENRAIAERMLRDGFIDSGTANYIINNEAMVEVEIWGNGNRGTALRITAF